MASADGRILERFILTGQKLLRPLPIKHVAARGPRGQIISSIVMENGAAAAPLGVLLAYVCLGGAIYGATMGAFCGASGPRPLQMIYSAVKVPMLLLVSFALTLPNFFVLNTLFGLRRDFHLAVQALVSAQAALGVVLASLAPLTAVWYLSTHNYPASTVFSGVMFAAACASAQWPLRRRYDLLIQHNPRHRIMLVLWLVIYIFVAIQMAWVLRPFLGDPRLPTTFFRHGAWGNAYVIVAEIVWRALGG